LAQGEGDAGGGEEDRDDQERNGHFESTSRGGEPTNMASAPDVT
jgi:hypothetical protein